MISGKLLEYMATEVPIISTGDPNSEAARFLNSGSHAWMVNEHNTSIIKKHLKENMFSVVWSVPNELLKDTNKDNFVSTRFEDKLIQLIDYELILLILLLLISFEWFVRKYNGLI